MGENPFGLEIIDAFVQMYPGQEGPTVPMPREALRDAESLAAWPGTGMADYLFGDHSEREARERSAIDPEAVLAELDRWGITRAQVPLYGHSSPVVFETLEAHPDRFFAALRVDPHSGMDGVRMIERLATRYPQIRSVSISPFMLWPSIPPNSKEYYPIYAKCVELGLPVFINVGFPGPRVPGESQNPIHLEEVCWFFPELTVVMRHGGQPWVDVCVRMLMRWPNLYYATTAYAPRAYPKQIIDYANGRGRDKIIYAGYWPVLSYEKIFDQLPGIGLRDEVWAAFLRDNAARVFRLEQTSEVPHGL